MEHLTIESVSKSLVEVCSKKSTFCPNTILISNTGLSKLCESAGVAPDPSRTTAVLDDDGTFMCWKGSRGH